MRFAHIIRLPADESGATAIEYGLIVALIAVAMIAALSSTGKQFSTTLNTVTTTMSGSV